MPSPRLVPRANSTSLTGLGLSQLQAAVLATVTYSDIFDYPLAADEIHRNLIGRSDSLESVRRCLDDETFVSRHLSRVDAFFCLRGRELVVTKRVRRRRAAETLWPLARRYGRLLASIPFVRGLAVTGALAPENEDADGDVDFLVLVQPGCVWRVHGFAWVLVKLHQLLGAGRLCANYIVSDDTPPLPERNLYIAYELSLMVALYGPTVVDSFRDTNEWRATYLPNARPQAKIPLTPLASPVKTALETLLNTAFGRWLETRVHGWKLRRVARRTSTIGLPNASNGDGVDEGWAKHERGLRVQQYREENIGFRGRHTTKEVTLHDLGFGDAILREFERRLTRVAESAT